MNQPKRISLEEANERKPDSPLFLYSETAEEYYDDPDLLLEAYVEAEQKVGGDMRSLSVRLCVDDPGNMPDSSDIIERACEEMYEGAYDDISDEACVELDKFLSAWWEKNRPPGVIPGDVFVDMAPHLEQYLLEQGLER